MKGTIDYLIDDRAQIYLTTLGNLNYELIQADKVFGFDNHTNSNPTSEEIEKVLKEKSLILENKKIKISTTLESDPRLNQFNVTVDGKETNSKAFGFEDLAIIVDQNSVWLLIRQGDKKQVEIMAEVIAKLSNDFDLFLVDTAQGYLVESILKAEFLNYFYT